MRGEKGLPGVPEFKGPRKESKIKPGESIEAKAKKLGIKSLAEEAGWDEKIKAAKARIEEAGEPLTDEDLVEVDEEGIEKAD